MKNISFRDFWKDCICKYRRIIILWVLSFCLFIPLHCIVIYAWFELSPKMDEIENLIGDNVSYVDKDGCFYSGILKSANYRFSDKIGFMDLNICIDGQEHMPDGSKYGVIIGRGLSPWDLWRIKEDDSL